MCNPARWTRESPGTIGWSKHPLTLKNSLNWFTTPSSAWRASAVVLAVPEDSTIREPRDLEGKVIATEVVHLTGKISACDSP